MRTARQATRIPTRIAAHAAACALVVMAGGCSPSGSAPTRPNLLLIVVDTLRADHLGCYGHTRDTSPEIDALARESILFERAYSVAPWTKPAIATMMTGRYPSHHGVDKMMHVLPPSADTLAEKLRAQGYRTAGVISHSLLGKQHGFDQGFEIYDESQARGHQHDSTPEVSRRATELLADLAADGAPFFLFVHFFDPHETYNPHADIDFAAKRAGRVSAGQSSPGLRKLDPPLEEHEIGLLRDLYDEEIRATDRGIGTILAALRESGANEHTMVVLTSDHGEEFFERGWLGHGTSMHDELLRVPLIVRPPHASGNGSAVSTPVSLVGLTPSVLDMLGADTSAASWDGQAWLLDGTPRRQTIHAELSYVPAETGKDLRTLSDPQAPWLRAVIQGDYKLVYDRMASSTRLFDLRNDPKELRDLADVQPDRTADMMRILEHGPKAGNAVERPTTTVTDAQKEALRQLGYSM